MSPNVFEMNENLKDENDINVVGDFHAMLFSCYVKEKIVGLVKILPYQ